MRIIHALFLCLALMGCASKSYPLARTPAMVVVCQGTDGPQAAVTVAQQHCAASGMDAQMVSLTGQLCSHGGGTYPGEAINFRCVAKQ